MRDTQEHRHIELAVCTDKFLVLVRIRSRPLKYTRRHTPDQQDDIICLCFPRQLKVAFEIRLCGIHQAFVVWVNMTASLRLGEFCCHGYNHKHVG